MPIHDKVIWSEGMFLRPQHLQQHDRFLDAQFRERTRMLSRYGWGIQHLKIDDQMLQQGAIVVTACAGVFPDGTLFQCHTNHGERLIAEVHPGQQNVIIHLALPVLLDGADDTAPASEETSLTRWIESEQDIQDSNHGASKTVQIKVALPRVQLLREDQLTADYTSLPIACIKESYADGRLEIDEHYVPPNLTIASSARLSYFLQETQSLLSHRAQAIASRLGAHAGKRGSSDLSDFLLLQLVNRYGAELKHAAHSENLHPEALFRILTTLHGEIATFTEESKLPKSSASYDHLNPTLCFNQLMSGIRDSLSLVFEQTALALPLQERRFGVRVAPIQDRILLDQAQFYLAVKCEWSSDTINTKLPMLTKAGGVEQLRELVNLQLPGIKLLPLPIAPRQIPYGSGFTYFQLEKSQEHWAQLKQSGGIAFHFSGEIPALELELWAVKG